MPIKVGVGLSTKKDTLQAASEAVSIAKANISTGKIDLAIVFTSIEFGHLTVIKAISNLLDSTQIIGSSSMAFICNQGIFEHGLAIMLLSLPQNIYFNTAYTKEISTKSALSAGEDFGRKLLYGFKDIRRNIGVVLSDGLILNESGFMLGAQERLGRSFPLIGASTLDSFRLKETNLYFNHEILKDAACGILWGGKLNFGLGIKHGWKPLGKPRVVTKSSANIVYEIEGIPAVTIYKEYLGYDLTKLRKELKYISIFYPIGIYILGEEEYLLRNILAIEDDGSLVFQGDVPCGSQIRLMIGTKESCLAATQQALEEVKKSLCGRVADFVLVFESISRYMLLRRQVVKELEIIKDELGENLPIIGIYTYGEQAPLKAINYQGRTYFHNQSIAILGIGG